MKATFNFFGSNLIITKILGFFTMIAILIITNGFVNNTAVAQQDQSVDYKTYKGKIIDSETKKPAIYASISIVGASIGTVSNKEGEFILKVKNNLNAKWIEISYIGYKKQKIAISELKPEGNVVKLVISTINVKDITVRPYDAKELLNLMMSKADENYSDKPNQMTAFYREAINKRGNCIYISEAIVDIYKGSYRNEFDNDLVKLYKGRRSSRVRAADTVMVKIQGGPSVSLLLDVVKNPYILFENDNIDKYEMKLSGMQVIDEKPIYVLEFTQKEKAMYPLYNGKLYINSETLALISAQFSLNLEDLNAATNVFLKRKPAGLKFVPLSTNYFVNYKEENGKFYFNYARYDLDFTCDWGKKLFKSKYNVMAEIAITNRDSLNVQKISFKDRMNKNDVFASKVSAFSDLQFWGDKNFIEPDKSIEEAITKYSKWLRKNTND
jgi:hypothetical protein